MTQEDQEKVHQEEHDSLSVSRDSVKVNGGQENLSPQPVLHTLLQLAPLMIAIIELVIVIIGAVVR